MACDRQTFEILEYPYAKDKEAIYYEGKRVSGIDAATFQILSHGYTKDKDAVYTGARKIAGADPLTFEVFKENDFFTDEFCYTKDGSSVFFDDKKLSDADMVTFKPLGNSCGSDNRHVFYKTKIIKDAQPAGFKVYRMMLVMSMQKIQNSNTTRVKRLQKNKFCLLLFVAA